MKAELPNKLWLDSRSVFFKKPNKSGLTEYTRTDAFIEKVARFLEYKLNDRVEIQVEGTLIPSLTSKKAFIEDFRNFIKG